MTKRLIGSQKKEAKPQTQKLPTTSKSHPKNRSKIHKGGSKNGSLKAEDITDDYIDNLINWFLA